jgi:hypothetical protein
VIRAGGLLAPLTLMLCPTVAEARPPIAWPTGLYSDVHSIAETDDILGLETRFYQEGDRQMVEIAWCEGWCNESHVSVVTRGHDGFAFELNRLALAQQGEVEISYRIVVWPARGGLRYSIYQDGQNIDVDGKPGRMRRITRPYGIAVAKSGRD